MTNEFIFGYTYVNFPNQLVEPEAAARSTYGYPVEGIYDNGIDQIGHFDLGCPPRELDFGIDGLVGKIALHRAHELGGDPLSGEILGPLHGRIFRHAEHPSRLESRGAAVDQVANFDDVGFVFHDPVVTGQTAVEETVLDVATDLLGSHETAVEFGIVDRRAIRTGIRRDFPTRFGEEGFGRILETALGQAEHE